MLTSEIEGYKQLQPMEGPAQLFSPQFWRIVEFKRYGIMVVLLLVQSAIGSLAAMYALQVDGAMAGILLSIVALLNMGANSICIAQASMKAMIYSGIASVVASLIVTAIAIAMI